MAETAAGRLAGAMPPPWRDPLASAIADSSFADLATFLEGERQRTTIYPPPQLVFRAFELTPPDAVRAVILGQDPYHGQGQAQGLAFSVPDDIDAPQSLRNILRELHSNGPRHSLELWARRGVLLLNTVLTVQQGIAGSHRNKGWERLTNAVITTVAASDRPIAFLLWGRAARSKSELILKHHIVHVAGHPASRQYPPRAADLYFAGRAGFSEVNEALPPSACGRSTGVSAPTAEPLEPGARSVDCL